MLLRYNAYVVYADVRVTGLACHTSVPYIECKTPEHVLSKLVGADRPVKTVVELRERV
jgi:hypothetical protein